MNNPRMPESCRVPQQVLDLWVQAPLDVELFAATDSAGRAFYQLSRPTRPSMIKATRFLNGSVVFHSIVNDIATSITHEEAQTALIFL